MSNIGYITSGKVGIHRFTYNELVELKKANVNFTLALTQLNNGPWMPLDSWNVVVASKKNMIKGFISLFFSNPILTFKLFKHSYKNKSIAYFLLAMGMYKSLKKANITSLHCQMGDKKLYIGVYLKKLLKKPLTVTVHAHELYQRDVYDNSQKIKNLFAECDKVITISDFNSKLVEQNLGVDKERIKVMKLFPDIDPEGYVNNKAKILIVANWAEKKGYKVLLDAIKKLDRNDFVLWVVGGSYFSTNTIDLNVMVKEYGLQDKVVLLGRQGGTVLEIIFSACDIFCLPSFTEEYPDGKPSEREGIPVALMEAMAWGKPVISTKHAGIPELVEDIVVEEKNEEQLRNAIEYMLDNRDKWESMGQRNKEIISNNYSKQNVQILVQEFKNVANE